MKSAKVRQDAAVIPPPRGEPLPPPRGVLARTKPPVVIAGLTRSSGLLLVLAALLLNLAVRTSVVSLAAPVAMAFAVIVLGRLGALSGTGPRLLAAGAIATSLWLPLRSSPWLGTLNALTAVGLLVAAVAIGRLSLWQLHPATMHHVSRRLRLGVHGPAALMRSSASLVGPVSKSGSKELLRGVLVAALAVGPIIVLLASADVVFASLLNVPGNAQSLGIHITLTVISAIAISSLALVGDGPQSLTVSPRRISLGATEATVVLTGMVLVFAVFAITQLHTALGGAQQIIETASLTRAEYAREGFFQLLAVSVITLVVLFAVRIMAVSPSPRVNFRLTLLSAITATLAVVVVVVSILRLALYVDAFGLTMLRLHSMAFAGLIGVVLLLSLGHLLAPVARLWFVPAVSLASWGLLMGLNVLNAEAFVAQWNIEHQTTNNEFDARYVAKLSPDAIPALVSGLDSLDAVSRADVSQTLCRTPMDVSKGWGPLGWNRARSEAASALEGARLQLECEPG